MAISPSPLKKPRNNSLIEQLEIKILSRLPFYTTQQIVEDLIAKNPEMLSQIAALPLKAFDPLIQMKNERLTRTVSQLVTEALTNSNYYKMTETLEQKIKTFVKISSLESMNQLKAEASELLQHSKASIQPYIKCARKIERALAPYFYQEFERQGKIRLIIHTAKDGHRFRFSKAKNRLETLWSLLTHKQELQELKTKLLSHITLKKPDGEKISSRKRFLDYRAQALWNAGEIFLKEALLYTFSKNNAEKAFLPKFFHEAVQNGAVEPYQHLTFDFLIQNTDVEIPTPFLCSVLSEYFGEEIPDVGAFMEKIIISLDQTVFEKLQEQVKKPDAKQAILDCLHQTFPQATFLTNFF